MLKKKLTGIHKFNKNPSSKMKNLIYCIMLLAPLVSSSQISFKDAKVAIHGNARFYTSTSGEGELYIVGNFKGELISCGINVVEHVGSYSQYSQKCGYNIRPYTVFDSANRLIGRGYTYKGYENSLPKDLVIFVLIEGESKAMQLIIKS